jgi:sRNA-binding regulator protein Hfq
MIFIPAIKRTMMDVKVAFISRIIVGIVNKSLSREKVCIYCITIYAIETPIVRIDKFNISLYYRHQQLLIFYFKITTLKL